jgi:hypothetical protein
MSSSRQSQTTAMVTVVGRGFGSAIAVALIDTRHTFHWIRAALRHPLAPGIALATVLAQLAPAIELGASEVAADAQRQGIGTHTFGAALQPRLTPAIVGAEIAPLCQDTGDQDEHRVYQLTRHRLHAMA